MADDYPGGGEDAERETDRERARIAHELVAGARGLPPSELPDALCRICATLLPVASGLSVSVLGDGSDTGVVLCASDGVAARLAEIQYVLGEGPCREAVREQNPVFAPDLAGPRDSGRWPLFSVQAADAGARAVFSLPLTGAGSALGTLDLYRETPGSLPGGQLRTALLVAEAVTVSVIALEHASTGLEGVGSWRTGAEADREQVHEATGMIMMRLGVGAEEALLRLRARAFAQDRTSAEVARAVMDGTLDLRTD
jgi:hypothetical protein